MTPPKCFFFFCLTIEVTISSSKRFHLWFYEEMKKKSIYIFIIKWNDNANNKYTQYTINKYDYCTQSCRSRFGRYQPTHIKKIINDRQYIPKVEIKHPKISRGMDRWVVVRIFPAPWLFSTKGWLEKAMRKHTQKDEAEKQLYIPGNAFYYARWRWNSVLTATWE